MSTRQTPRASPRRLSAESSRGNVPRPIEALFPLIKISQHADNNAPPFFSDLITIFPEFEEKMRIRQHGTATEDEH